MDLAQTDILCLIVCQYRNTIYEALSYYYIIMLAIINKHNLTHPRGWQNYTVCISLLLLELYPI